MYTRTKKINPKEITLKKEIATGTFGTTFHAYWNKQACVAKKAHTPLLESFNQEVKILEQLSQSPSPYIVQYYGKITAPYYYIMLEFVSGGDLRDFIKDNMHKIWQPHYSIMSDIANGLTLLHTQYKILHLDIKSENILLTEKLKSKLCDFGCAMHIKDIDPDSSFQPVGTVETFAPEMIETNTMSSKSDVYSMGITFWELSAKSDIFADLEHLSQHEYIKAAHQRKLSSKPATIPKQCPSRLARLIKWCWQADPDKRPEAKDVVDTLEKIKL